MFHVIMRFVFSYCAQKSVVGDYLLFIDISADEAW